MPIIETEYETRPGRRSGTSLQDGADTDSAGEYTAWNRGSFLQDAAEIRENMEKERDAK